jgi:hypothetical protein
MSANTSQQAPKFVVCHLDEEPSCLELTKINLETMDSTLKIWTFHDPTDLINELMTGQCDCIIVSYKQRSGTVEEILPEITGITDAPIILYSIYDENEIIKVKKLIDYYVQKQPKIDHYKKLLAVIHEAISNQ